MEYFLALSLRGFGSVSSILCLVALVHPISLSSNVKISWYSANKSSTLSLFSSVQDSRPESSNFSNKIFLLSSTVSSVWPSLANLQFQRAPIALSVTTILGTSLAATILATAVPFLIIIVWSLVLYSWTVVFKLLQLYVSQLGCTCSPQGRALSS